MKTEAKITRFIILNILEVVAYDIVYRFCILANDNQPEGDRERFKTEPYNVTGNEQRLSSHFNGFICVSILLFVTLHNALGNPSCFKLF